MDTVLIEGLKLRSVIGVHAWERAIRQRLQLDLALTVDTSAAGQSDAIEDAVDYAELSARLTQLAEAAEWQLIEALAEQLAQAALTDRRIKTVTLTLRKPGALPAARSVGVTIIRSQTEDA